MLYELFCVGIAKIVNLWCQPIKKAQRSANKSHILDRYDENANWRENLYW